MSLHWIQLFNSLTELRSSLIEGRVGRVIIENKAVCLVFINNKLFAFDENCPHMNKSLFGGICEAGDIICPIHKFKFNLETGMGHGLTLQKHLIKREGDQFFISFNS